MIYNLQVMILSILITGRLTGLNIPPSLEHVHPALAVHAERKGKKSKQRRFQPDISPQN